MASPEDEARFRAAEDAEIARKRAEEQDMEKRYYKENSGLGYRRNEQDGLIFVMGNCAVPLCITVPHVFPSCFRLIYTFRSVGQVP